VLGKSSGGVSYVEFEVFLRGGFEGDRTGDFSRQNELKGGPNGDIELVKVAERRVALGRVCLTIIGRRSRAHNGIIAAADTDI
jgi:hypothetical protein